MPTLKVSAKGQITITKDLRQHLGIRPGGKIDVVKSSDGSLTITATKPTGSIESVFGMLAGKTKKKATLEEIKRATEDGWDGLVKFD